MKFIVAFLLSLTLFVGCANAGSIALDETNSIQLTFKTSDVDSNGQIKLSVITDTFEPAPYNAVALAMFFGSSMKDNTEHNYIGYVITTHSNFDNVNIFTLFVTTKKGYNPKLAEQTVTVVLGQRVPFAKIKTNVSKATFHKIEFFSAK